MKNLPKEKRDRLILVGLGCLAVVAGLYYGVISIQRNSLEELAKKQVDQEVKLKQGERLSGSTPQIQQNLESTLAQLRAVESTMVPGGDMYSWIILTVNTFKENYRVEIPQFSREVAAEVGMYAKYPYRAVVFHLRGTAYYHDFGRFVADFENAFPYMRIQNIELDPASASAASPQQEPEKLSFRLEIVALVNPNPR
jgi:Tfp pilus assembly protein PilO